MESANLLWLNEYLELEQAGKEGAQEVDAGGQQAEPPPPPIQARVVDDRRVIAPITDLRNMMEFELSESLNNYNFTNETRIMGKRAIF